MNKFLTILLPLILLSFTSCGKIKVSDLISPPEIAPPTAPGCGPAVAHLKWTIPTQKADASLLDNLYGYEFSWGVESRFDVGSYTDSMVVINNSINTFDIESLPAGQTLYFGAKAINTNSNKSVFSGEVAFKVPSPCLDGQKPQSVKAETVYDVPDWCKRSIELTYWWTPVKYITNYKFTTAYRRGFPSDIITLSRKATNFQIKAKRGQSIYTQVAGVNGDRFLKLSKETKYNVLTCKQLEEILKKNPKYKEKLKVQLLWNK